MRKKQDPSDLSIPWKKSLLVGLTAFLLYLPAAWNDFTFDDWSIVVQNPAVQEWGNWKLLLFSDYWPGARSALYRPVTLLSFALERVVHGPEPAGFHLVNIALHAALSTFVFLVAFQSIGSVWAAWIAGTLFAVHPLHTEPVIGIVGRAELLSAFFVIAAFWLWARRWRLGRIRENALWAWALGLSFLAILAKEGAIVFPALVILGEISLDPGLPWGSRLRAPLTSPRILSFVGMAALALLLRTAALGGVEASLNPDPPFVENPAAREAPDARIATALSHQWRGMLLHVAPNPLIADYSHETLPVRRQPLGPTALAAAGAILAALLAWGIRGLTPLALWSSWYVVTLLPSSNILFPIGTIFGERLLYLPSIGFCLFVGVLAGRVRGLDASSRRFPSEVAARLLLVGFAVIVLGGAFLTFQRIQDWKNDFSLFTDTVRKAPRNVKARLWLGDSLAREGRYGDALAEYDRALELYPDYPAAATNRIVPLVNLGRYAEAIEAGERARKLLDAESPILLYNLALAYRAAGNTIQFLDFIQRSLNLDSRNAQAHLQLGMYYFQETGEHAAARRHLEEAMRLGANLPDSQRIQRLLDRIAK